MKSIKTKLTYFLTVSIIIFCISPIFTLAWPPPEYVVARGARITVGTQKSGTSYTDTYYQDDEFLHIIICEEDGGDWDFKAVVFYEFAGKCSKVKIWADDNPHQYAPHFTVRAHYTDETSQTVGSFKGGDEYHIFNLNSAKNLDEIEIEYIYEALNPPDGMNIEIDYIRVLWTGA